MPLLIGCGPYTCVVLALRRISRLTHRALLLILALFFLLSRSVSLRQRLCRCSYFCLSTCLCRSLSPFRLLPTVCPSDTDMGIRFKCKKKNPKFTRLSSRLTTCRCHLAGKVKRRGREQNSDFSRRVVALYYQQTPPLTSSHSTKKQSIKHGSPAGCLVTFPIDLWTWPAVCSAGLLPSTDLHGRRHRSFSVGRKGMAPRATGVFLWPTSREYIFHAACILDRVPPQK